MSKIKDAKDDFIDKGALVLQHELALATGGKSPLDAHKISTKNHPVIVENMLELIKAQQEIQMIEANNSKDVLKALSTGKISIKDAKEMVALMSMVKLENDMGKGSESRSILISIAKGGAK